MGQNQISVGAWAYYDYSCTAMLMVGIVRAQCNSMPGNQNPSTTLPSTYMHLEKKSYCMWTNESFFSTQLDWTWDEHRSKTCKQWPPHPHGTLETFPFLHRSNKGNLVLSTRVGGALKSILRRGTCLVYVWVFIVKNILMGKFQVGPHDTFSHGRCLMVSLGKDYLCKKHFLSVSRAVFVHKFYCIYIMMYEVCLVPEVIDADQDRNSTSMMFNVCKNH